MSISTLSPVPFLPLSVSPPHTFDGVPKDADAFLNIFLALRFLNYLVQILSATISAKHGNPAYFLFLAKL